MLFFSDNLKWHISIYLITLFLKRIGLLLAIFLLRSEKVAESVIIIIRIFEINRYMLKFIKDFEKRRFGEKKRVKIYSSKETMRFQRFNVEFFLFVSCSQSFEWIQLQHSGNQVFCIIWKIWWKHVVPLKDFIKHIVLIDRLKRSCSTKQLIDYAS